MFQAGRLRANVRLQRANLKAAEESFRSTVLKAMGEVENALDASNSWPQWTKLWEWRMSSRKPPRKSLRSDTARTPEHHQVLEARRRAISAESNGGPHGDGDWKTG
ncbi:MAG: hypothetical protein CM1200mP29_05230 [Verrucomicrobiota bacterium]|nr:MAG: hypothetical protein CM1200mP29_05230 [Verrucomicrobiota bacterium]